MTIHLEVPRLLSLEGRIAVVAGAAGGIGSAAVGHLAAAGAQVIGLDLPGREVHGAEQVLACDLTDSGSVAAAFRSIEEQFGRLDVVVHCAGIARDGVLWKTSDEDWREVLRANLGSAFALLRAATPLLRVEGGGAVVLVSSINGERGKFGQANYAASKAGLIGLARTAALELGHFGVRVNCVAPGLIRTAMTADLSEEVLERALEETALERLGEPEDVARAILFLCSDLARHVTGQVLRVDGGQLMA